MEREYASTPGTCKSCCAVPLMTQQNVISRVYLVEGAVPAPLGTGICHRGKYVHSIPTGRLLKPQRQLTGALLLLAFVTVVAAHAAHSHDLTLVKQVREAESVGCDLCLLPALHSPALVLSATPPQTLWLLFSPRITLSLENSSSPHHVRPPPPSAL